MGVGQKLRTNRRFPILLAAVLAIVGALLITIAASSSRSGPPQPSAAAAGVIDAPAPSTSTATSATSVPTGATSVARPTAGKTTAGKTTAGKTTAGKTTAPKPTATKATTPTSTKPAPPKPITAPKPQTSGPILPASRPVSLSIPKIGVATDLVDLGINPDGTVQVPSLDDPDSKAGWYKLSPSPGALGPSIILGHIDSKKYGPGVFYNLGKLMPGDLVNVTRQDGTVAVFRIDGVRSYPKSDFPTFQVYGNLDHAGLRLITCGGVFDADQGSYESNIVAYATLVSSHKK